MFMIEEFTEDICSFKGIHTFRGDNYQNCFCFPSEKASPLKG